MNSIPFICFYPATWYSGSARLTDLEDHILFKICLEQWKNGEAINQQDVPRLFKSPDTDKIKEAIENLVRLEKVERDEHGRLSSDRAQRAWSDAQQRIFNARKGGYARALQQQSGSSARAKPQVSYKNKNNNNKRDMGSKTQRDTSKSDLKKSPRKGTAVPVADHLKGIHELLKE